MSMTAREEVNSIFLLRNVATKMENWGQARCRDHSRSPCVVWSGNNSDVSPQEFPLC